MILVKYDGSWLTCYLRHERSLVEVMEEKIRSPMQLNAAGDPNKVWKKNIVSVIFCINKSRLFPRQIYLLIGTELQPAQFKSEPRIQRLRKDLI